MARVIGSEELLARALSLTFAHLSAHVVPPSAGYAIVPVRRPAPWPCRCCSPKGSSAASPRRPPTAVCGAHEVGGRPCLVACAWVDGAVLADAAAAAAAAGVCVIGIATARCDAAAADALAAQDAAHQQPSGLGAQPRM